MTTDQLNAIAELTDRMRAQRKSYAEVVALLKGGRPPLRMTEEELRRIHRRWERRERGAETDRAAREVEFEEGEVLGSQFSVPGFEGAEVGADEEGYEAEEGEEPRTENREPGTPPGRDERLYEVLEYLAGEVVRQNVGWESACERVVKPGFTWERRLGPGSAGGAVWLTQAVVFLGADGAVVEVFPEHRPRRLRPIGWNACKNPTLLMERLTLSGATLHRAKREVAATRGRLGRVGEGKERETLERKLERQERRVAELIQRGGEAAETESLACDKMLSRMAAVLATYFPEKSGLLNAGVLARATGVSRQAVHQRKQRLGAEYVRNTGGKAGFVGLSVKTGKTGKTGK